MGITFAYRSDQLTTARFGLGGLEGAFASSGIVDPTLVSDAGAIGGNYLNLVDGTSRLHVHFNGRENIPATPNMSVLVRIKWPSFTSFRYEIFHSGGIDNSGNMTNRFDMWHNRADNTFALRVGGQRTILQTEFSASVSALNPGQWYDVLMSWDGTTNANGMKIWLDGVLQGQSTAANALNNSGKGANRNPLLNNEIVVAGGTHAGNHVSACHINEVIVWDEIIDPSQNITLTGGPGLLNGSSRTEFVDVETNPTPVFPSAVNVREGIVYGSEGDDQTGLLDLPAEADVRDGVEYDMAASTGTLDLPSINDVRSGVTFDNGTKVGNLASIEYAVSNLSVDSGSNAATLESEVE